MYVCVCIRVCVGGGCVGVDVGVSVGEHVSVC